MRRIIGCKYLDHATLSDVHDEIWCDDLGLTGDGPVWAFQLVNGHAKVGPFAGKCIIVGNDDYGNSAPPRIPRVMIENNVDWLDQIVPELHTITEPVDLLGRQAKRIRTFVTWSRPK